MTVTEHEITLPFGLLTTRATVFEALHAHLRHHLQAGDEPIRFAISRTEQHTCRAEVGILTRNQPPNTPDIFQFIPRTIENTDTFNAALVIPTGIGCEIGGHAGDAGSVARLIGAACDRLILHPNVVNGSDINEMPDNALYVEGSILSRFLQGSVGLAPVRKNRILVVTDAQRDRLSHNAVINSVNAARACYGIDCPKIIVLDPPVHLRGDYTASGRAAGTVTGLERLLSVLEDEHGNFDAIALAGGVELHFAVYTDYLRGDGDKVNPVGGIEAIYTHAVSALTQLPVAHAPIFVFDDAPHVSAEVWAVQPGIVDPRMAAEVVSLAFLQSVLKGLQHSPRIVPRSKETFLPGMLTASDISCLIIPDGVLGLPTLAALVQGIPVIAVRENRNLCQNDLSRLDWRTGQYIVVENYLEAVGAMTALRAGLSFESLRRPIARTAIQSR